MALGSLDETLGWFGDLFSVHAYRDDVPMAMRRRWSFDGDGWSIVDDVDNEVLRISLAEAGSGESGTVPSPTTVNTLLRSVDGSTLSWGKLVDAMVDAAAAIAGTKISPDFGAQSITTTGNLLLGATPRAAAGQVMLPNNVAIAWRDAANGVDIRTRVSAADAWIVDGAATIQLVESGGDTLELTADAFTVTLAAVNVIEVTPSAIDIRTANDERVHLEADEVSFDVGGQQALALAEQSYVHNTGIVKETTSSFTHTLAGGAGATNVTVFSPTTSDGEYLVTARVVARDTVSGDCAGYVINAAFKVRSSTLSLIGASNAAFTAENDAAWNSVLAASGANIVLTNTPDGTNQTVFEGTIHVMQRGG